MSILCCRHFGRLLARRIVKSDDLSALGSYVSSYASLTVQQPADIISVLWAYLRYPAAAFLLGFTAWGVMLLPAAVYGAGVLFVLQRLLLRRVPGPPAG